MSCADFLIIGGGIAGASVAYRLAPHGAVVLLEREVQPGMHATGRSAAFFAESYGGPRVQPLTAASRRFLEGPPGVFGDVPVMTPRGALYIARSDQMDRLEQMFAAYEGAIGGLRRLGPDEVLEKVAFLRPGYVAGGLFEPGCRDLDVAALHQGFLRGLKAAGGTVMRDAEVRGLSRANGRWLAETAQGAVEGRVVVNAAGAWGDAVARMAGARPVGLVPKRRTVITFRAPPGVSHGSWPLTLDIGEQFYFKPETGRILASPADETPVPPCDAQPEEWDVALTVDRLQKATALEVPGIENKWAGLRTFAPDNVPVVGYDPDVAGFFWCCGQGGFGIQTAPALSQLAASSALGSPMPDALAKHGVRPQAYAPGRFGNEYAVASPFSITFSLRRSVKKG